MTRKIDAAPESVILRSAYASDADFKRAIIAALVAGRVVRSSPEYAHVSYPASLTMKPIELPPGIGGYRWVKEDDARFGFFRLEKA